MLFVLIVWVGSDLVACIVNLLDCYKTHEDAIAIIREVSGTQLDAELVDIFLKIPKEELIACAPPKVEIIEANIK